MQQSTSASASVAGTGTSASASASVAGTGTSTGTNVSTYLGPNGYTIYKDCLEKPDIRLLREELNVRPYIPKSPIQTPAYPVFRENEQKFFLPRYYGLKNYGTPEENRLPPGTDIHVPFVGDLRDYQLHIVDVYKQAAADVGGGLLEIPCGRGKTVIALKIISEMKKKTLVIVHKGFLLNQWIERMTQFLPTARVGRIQGQIIDIEDKDIVIGMLQSLSMKEYPATLFHSFGLTIVDECHHISSEVFCRSLQKIMTAYTLGLSATMNRKDGLTKVFKMFLGEIVYSEERENTDQVLVKAIQYEVDNADFNEMCYDYRGNPAYSTMISKLCAFSPRSEFLMQVLTKELAAAKEIGLAMQVMILAHNKNLLTYLHDAIQHRGIATVGYYVGGMKEAALKASETCQVIIATYAMAAEALDIKTLTTLILATPKTDIVQAVGRILRVKHERPMVIDLIDSHEVFLSQWQKRRKYYTSNQYKIMHTKSGLYASGEWTNIGGSKTAKSTSKSAAGTIATTSTGTSTSKAAKSTCKIDVSGLNGTNLLTKGVAAAARLINMNKKEYNDEDQDSADSDSDQDEDQDEDDSDSDKRVTIIHSIHELSLKGKCFI